MQTESFNQITSNEECVKYEDKFILSDNLNQADEPKIMNNTTVYNEQYRCSVIVVQGALNMVINGISLRVKANEYLTVMPYTSIEIKSSRCKFFCIKIEAYIIHDIFNSINIGINALDGCYTFNHYRLTPRQIETLTHDYLHMKEDMLSPLFKNMRIDIIKARLCTYISHKYTFIDKLPQIPHYQENESSQLFISFMDLLSKNYKKERSVQFYSQLLGVQPKNLSTVTVKYTGKTASRVIDEYVTLHIKVVLYNNRYNIKEVSDMFNFASQSFFGRYFKRVAGCSPRKYVSTNSKKLSKKS